jgi:hypothetical protein
MKQEFVNAASLLRFQRKTKIAAEDEDKADQSEQLGSPHSALFNKLISCWRV